MPKKPDFEAAAQREFEALYAEWEFRRTSEGARYPFLHANTRLLNFLAAHRRPFAIGNTLITLGFRFDKSRYVSVKTNPAPVQEDTP
jgi:hypothetical protein